MNTKSMPLLFLLTAFMLLLACSRGSQTADTPIPESKVVAKVDVEPSPTKEIPKREPTNQLLRPRCPYRPLLQCHRHPLGCNRLLSQLRYRRLLPQLRCRRLLSQPRYRRLLSQPRCHRLPLQPRCHRHLHQLRCRLLQPRLRCHPRLRQRQQPLQLRHLHRLRTG
jgi:hypothetical protein